MERALLPPAFDFDFDCASAGTRTADGKQKQRLNLRGERPAPYDLAIWRVEPYLLFS